MRLPNESRWSAAQKPRTYLGPFRGVTGLPDHARCPGLTPKVHRWVVGVRRRAAQQLCRPLHQTGAPTETPS